MTRLLQLLLALLLSTWSGGCDAVEPERGAAPDCLGPALDVTAALADCGYAVSGDAVSALCDGAGPAHVAVLTCYASALAEDCDTRLADAVCGGGDLVPGGGR